MKNRLLVFLFLILSTYAYGQNCTLSVTISQSAPTICSGYSVTLTATTSGGTAPFSYSWSTGETTPSIMVDKPGTYKVTVTDKTPGCPPVKQSVTVTSTTSPNAPTANGQVVCINSSATLTATAPGGVYQWYDAVTGGNFLSTGATYVTPPITQPTIFYVQTTIGGCTSSRTPVLVNVAGKPLVTGVSICSGNVATLIASGGNSFIWYDAPSGGNVLSTDSIFTTPVLTSTTTYYVASVSKTGCQSPRAAATVTVTPQPQPPTAANVTVCSGSPANLHATGMAAIYNWYNAPSGGVPLISSPDYTTPPLTANATYYVSDANNGCESGRVPVTVTVTPLPAAPAAQNDTTCYQTSITLNAGASGAATYRWFDAPNGNLLATGITFTTPVLTNSTTYYLQAVNGGCVSAFAQVNVVVRQQLAAPTAAGALVCLNSSATLTATAQGGGIFQWYNAAAGGKLLATGASFTTPSLAATTTYYVQNTQLGCVSQRAAVTVTVLPAIAPPTASNVTTCAGDSTVLTASGSSGGYAWYSTATGGNPLSTAQAFVTPVLNANTTYFVEATLNGCASARVAVRVTVNPTPTTPTVNGVTICSGMSAKLSATGTNGTVQWYDAPSGGNLLATGNPFTTPALTTTTTYYAVDVSGQCMSAVVPVTVTVSTTPQFKYAQNAFCIHDPNPIPVINNPGGGTFTASPAGLVFVSNKTGEINISATVPGDYTVTFTGKGSYCSVPESQTIAIGASFTTNFSYAGPYCQGGPDPSPTFNKISVPGNFSAAPAGLVFINSSTGQIDLANSKQGTYTVTNSISSGGACPGSSTSAQVTIYQKATVSAGPNQMVASGAPVQLAGSVTGGATTGTWSGGTGSFSNNASLTPIYTPGPGETKAVLKLTSAAPQAPCGPVSATVTIIFTTQPQTPAVQSVAVCSGSSATLSATAPGGTYQWYDAATGGNLLNTGPDFTTPPLTTTTTYYVQTTINGVTSARTAATATVNPIPVAPTAAGGQTCTGTTATLTASGSTGTYEWYDAITGGNLLASGSTYTTPNLTTNTSYFVQTTVNGCVSTRTQVDVLITPKPNVTSAATGTICSGQPQSYNITADLVNTTFLWSRAQVAGISNPAVTNQTSSTITETLINTGTTSVNVTYVITPSAGNCPGPAFNYVVTVYPAPTVTSSATATICNMSTDNYAIAFNGPVTSFSWSRAAVPGIKNLPVSGQAAAVIREVLFNTTNQPVNVTYVFTYSTPSCSGIPFNLVMTVNPQDTITSSPRGNACTAEPQNYVITGSIPSSTFLWSRAAVANISNPAVSNQTSGTITEALVNTSFSLVPVEYDITPIANGCPGTPFKYIAIVNPKLPVPIGNSNSPICVGSDLHLSAVPVTNASYLWTGPNGFTSTLQSPVIPNATAAASGTYNLSISIRGCSGTPVPIQVNVDAPPVVNAGNDTSVCVNTPFIQLAGSVSGGTTTGIWTTSGSGNFTPMANVLNAHYVPSVTDTTAGSVTLTLTSTSKDNCAVASDSIKVTFSKQPAVVPGPNQDVCSQTKAVQLDGKVTIAGGGTWTTAGDGTFIPSATQLNATYVPGATDPVKGSVVLTLSANNPGVCFTPSGSLTVTFIPPPTVYAGGTRFVLVGSTITLYPTVSDGNVHYLWSPNIDINNDTLKNPVITGDINRVYTLTVTDTRGCVAQDTALIKVSPIIKINNTFTPNGDGVNDYWDIIGLIAYQEATVDIFDRWGQKVFHSLGYPKPWDGTFNGKPVPIGVYYYLINTHFNGQVLSGYVTVIR
jgi:gliding motility-associated-like protein